MRTSIRDTALLPLHPEAIQKHLLHVQETSKKTQPGEVLPVANLDKTGFNPEKVYKMTAINSLFLHCTYRGFLEAHRSSQTMASLLLKFNYLPLTLLPLNHL